MAGEGVFDDGEGSNQPEEATAREEGGSEQDTLDHDLIAVIN